MVVELEWSRYKRSIGDRPFYCRGLSMTQLSLSGRNELTAKQTDPQNGGYIPGKFVSLPFAEFNICVFSLYRFHYRTVCYFFQAATKQMEVGDPLVDLILVDLTLPYERMFCSVWGVFRGELKLTLPF